MHQYSCHLYIHFTVDVPFEFPQPEILCQPTKNVCCSEKLPLFLTDAVENFNSLDVVKIAVFDMFRLWFDILVVVATRNCYKFSARKFNHVTKITSKHITFATRDVKLCWSAFEMFIRLKINTFPKGKVSKLDSMLKTIDIKAANGLHVV